MENTSKIFEELSDNMIKAIMLDTFPNKILLSWLLLTGGMFNTTYKTTFTDGTVFVLRVAPVNRERLLPYENNLMRAEELFNSLCKKANIHVSNTVAVNTEKKIIDRDFMIVEFIDSVPLSRISAFTSWIKGYHMLAGKIARQLREIKGQRFGRLTNICKGISFEKWSECILYELDEIITKCNEFPAFTQEELAKIRNYFVDNSEALDEIQTPTLVHGDIWSGNVLIAKKKKQVVTLIDGDRSFFGDAELEIVTSWMNKKKFLKGYGHALDNSQNAIVRRKLYTIFYILMDAYVWKVEYANDERYLIKKHFLAKEMCWE